MKLRLFIFLGLIHLKLVTFGALELDLSGQKIYTKLIRIYGALTGSNANYSFFAPKVGSPLRASFYLTNDKGETIVEGTDTSDRELSLRRGNMVDAFRSKLTDENARRAIAASWSGLVLAKYPEAKTVRFVLDEYHIPKMNEFNNGAKMEWVEDYSATFERRR